VYVGDVCFDKTSGFWLVHSVPNFPPNASDGYSYPDSGTVFGQTFLCVTYEYSELNAIGRILRPCYSWSTLMADVMVADVIPSLVVHPVVISRKLSKTDR